MIIGLTGTNGSGKTVTADHLKAKGFFFHSFSDEIRLELERHGLAMNRENLIETGNRLRAEYGSSILAERVKAKLRSDQNYVVDSIRNPAEMQALRAKGNFHLLHLDAVISDAMTDSAWRSM
jgi:dephospho-CoA kinase